MKNLLLAVAATLTMSACCGEKCENSPKTESLDNVIEMSKPIRLNVFYTANNPADHQQIVDIASKLVEASRRDAGCLGYDFYSSGTVPGEYIIIETWENDSVLDIHSHAPHFTELVPQLHSLGEMRLERYE